MKSKSKDSSDVVEIIREEAYIVLSVGVTDMTYKGTALICAY